MQDAVKEKNGIIIQPMEDQDYKITFDSLRKNISLNDENINLTKIRTMKKGALLIECGNPEDTIKLQNAVKEVLGNKYNVRNPKFRNPKIKIIGLSESVDEDQLKMRIIQQNLHLKCGFEIFKLIICKKMKSKYMAIVEMDGVSFKKITDLQYLFIGFDKCPVFEHLDVNRCYECGDYNHVIANCKNKKVCLQCGEESHSSRECDNNPKCVNCVRVNNLRDIKLKTDHTCYDKDCELLKSQFKQCKLRTNYIITPNIPHSNGSVC